MSASPATEEAHRTGPGPAHLGGPSPILPTRAWCWARKYWMKEGRNTPYRILKLTPPLLALTRAPKNITQRPRTVVWRMQKNHSARPGNQTSQNLTSLNHTIKALSLESQQIHLCQVSAGGRRLTICLPEVPPWVQVLLFPSNRGLIPRPCWTEIWAQMPLLFKGLMPLIHKDVMNPYEDWAQRCVNMVKKKRKVSVSFVSFLILMLLLIVIWEFKSISVLYW